MALNRFVFKSLKSKKLFLKFEIKRLTLRFLLCEEKIDRRKKMFYMSRLSILPRTSSLVRIKNYCLITGRSRAVYRKFSLSRGILKNYISSGKIAYYRKSGW